MVVVVHHSGQDTARSDRTSFTMSLSDAGPELLGAKAQAQCFCMPSYMCVEDTLRISKESMQCVCTGCLLVQ